MGRYTPKVPKPQDSKFKNFFSTDSLRDKNVQMRVEKEDFERRLSNEVEKFADFLKRPNIILNIDSTQKISK